MCWGEKHLSTVADVLEKVQFSSFFTLFSCGVTYSRATKNAIHRPMQAARRPRSLETKHNPACLSVCIDLLPPAWLPLGCHFGASVGKHERSHEFIETSILICMTLAKNTNNTRYIFVLFRPGRPSVSCRLTYRAVQTLWPSPDMYLRTAWGWQQEERRERP